MERYFKVAKNNVRITKVRQELTESEFLNALWVEANELAWRDCIGMQLKDCEETYTYQENLCQNYIDSLRYTTHTYVMEYEENNVVIAGGKEIGDYVYYLVTDDRITIQDLPRRN